MNYLIAFTNKSLSYLGIATCIVTLPDSYSFNDDIGCPTGNQTFEKLKAICFEQLSLAPEHNTSALRFLRDNARKNTQVLAVSKLI